MECLAGCGGGPVIVPQSPVPQPVSKAPSVTATSPNTGPTAGGVNVEIDGSNFQAGAAVVFGLVQATSVMVVSSSRLMAMAPPHPAGAVDLKVTNPDNESTIKTQAFTYVQAPSISGVSPSSGPATGGTTVTITGAGFQVGPPPSTVSFGGSAATSATVASGTQIQAVTPAHAGGAVDVVVTNPDGQNATAAGAFSYIGGPMITSVMPGTGSTAGGTLVTIIGSGFQAGLTVLIGGSAATGITVFSSSQIQLKTPPGAAGMVSVTVTNPDSSVANLANGFAYAPAPPPGCGGPPNYCARTDTMPAPPTRAPLPPCSSNPQPCLGAAGSVYVDPDFSERILRVTDASTAANFKSVRTPSSASQTVFSIPNVSAPPAADGSYYFGAHMIGGSPVIFYFDPVAFTATRVDNAPGQLGYNGMQSGDDGIQFAYTQPRTLYATKNPNGSLSAPVIAKFSFAPATTPPLTWTVTDLEDTNANVTATTCGLGGTLSAPANSPPPPAKVTVNTASGLLPAGTYLIDVAYYETTSFPGSTATIESQASADTTVVLTSNGSITVMPPPIPPSAALGYRVYIGQVPLHLAMQGQVSGFSTSFTQSTPLILAYDPASGLGGGNNQSCTTAGCHTGNTSLSADDHRYALTTGGAVSNSDYIIFVNDQSLPAGQNCRWYNTFTGQIGGTWPGVPNGFSTLNLAMGPTAGGQHGFRLHNVKISADGRFIELTIGGGDETFVEDGISPGSDFPRAFWDVGTLNVIACASSGVVPGEATGCAGHFDSGWQQWMTNLGNSSDFDFRLGQFLPFDSTTLSTQVKLVNPTFRTGVHTQAGHAAWRDVTSAATADAPLIWDPYLVSGGPFAVAGDGEVVGVSLLGCPAACGQVVYRFAHNFSAGDRVDGFFSSPRGGVSQDGKYFLFNSDWLATHSYTANQVGVPAPLLSESGASTCTTNVNCRQDVFLVELK